MDDMGRKKPESEERHLTGGAFLGACMHYLYN
jgi:hypothetical protein